MTPSNMSGALPMTTASMSLHVMPASSSARLAASRTRPAMDTSCRLAAYLVWPTPTTATRLLTSASPPATQQPRRLRRPSFLPFQDRDEVLLQARPGRRVRDRSTSLAGSDAGRSCGEPLEAADHHRSGGGVDRDAVEAQ